MEPKPGVKTSELWLAVANSIIALLVVYGIINQDEAHAWQGLASAVIVLALSIGAGVYAYSRAKVKSNS